MGWGQLHESLYWMLQLPFFPTISSILVFTPLRGIAVSSLFAAILSFFIGRGLFKGRKWARDNIIIFAVLDLLILIIKFSGAFILYTDKLGLKITAAIFTAMSLCIAGFFLYNPSMKSVFSK